MLYKMQEQGWGETKLIMKHWTNGEAHCPGSMGVLFTRAPSVPFRREDDWSHWI